MRKHRITRREIKHDEFVTTVGKITGWVEANSRLLLVGAACAVGLFLAGYGIFAWRESRYMRAEAALGRVTEAFHATVGGDAPGDEAFATDAERYAAAVERADEVITSYGSTPAGQRARYYRALALYDGGQLDPAREAFDDFLARHSDHFLAPFARWKLGQIRERQGDLEGACDAYRELLEVEVPEFPNEVAYLDLARCLRSMGESVQAADTYRRMLDQYPESLYANDARQQLVEIEGSPG